MSHALETVGDVALEADSALASAALWEDAGLTIDELLRAEARWSGPSDDPEAVRRLRAAFNFYVAVYSEILVRWRPRLLAVWNGQHTPEVILRALAARAGCPVTYLERGPFPATLYFDRRGILGDGSIVAQPSLRLEPAEDQRGKDALRFVRHAIGAGNLTWWQQSSAVGAERLRKKLRLPSDRPVVLFAEQLEADTQSFSYSPTFPTPLAAFDWLNRSLAGRRDVYVLGKSHPLSKRAARDWAPLFRVPGTWSTDVNLFDALSVATHAAGVNSTLLYEAMLAGKPTLAMGRGLFSGRDFFYEVTDDADRETIAKWLEAPDLADRAARFEEFAAYLLRRNLYAYGISDEESYPGLHSADLADQWRTIAEGSSPSFERISTRRTGDAILRLATALPQQLLRQRVEAAELGQLGRLTRRVTKSRAYRLARSMRRWMARR